MGATFAALVSVKRIDSQSQSLVADHTFTTIITDLPLVFFATTAAADYKLASRRWCLRTYERWWV